MKYKKINQEIRDEINDSYAKMLITRAELAEKHKISLRTITNYMHCNKIYIWDTSKLNKNIRGQIIDDYCNKKIARAEIQKKYKVSYSQLYWILKVEGIKLWDLQKEPTNEKPERDISDEIYYWKKDKSPYAKIFYEFNK